MSRPPVSYKVTLRITGVPELHDKISDELRVNPSRIHHQGDSMNKAFPFLGDRKFSRDVWQLDAPKDYELSASEQIKWVKDLLRLKPQYLEYIRSLGGSIDVVISCIMRENMFHFALEAEHLRVFAEMGVPVSILVTRGAPAGKT